MTFFRISMVSDHTDQNRRLLQQILYHGNEIDNGCYLYIQHLCRFPNFKLNYHCMNIGMSALSCVRFSMLKSYFADFFCTVLRVPGALILVFALA
jgi:hypothetical protein